MPLGEGGGATFVWEGGLDSLKEGGVRIEEGGANSLRLTT